jgi:hypothetical protein
MFRIIPPLPHTFSWRDAEVGADTGTNLTFYVQISVRGTFRWLGLTLVSDNKYYINFLTYRKRGSKKYWHGFVWAYYEEIWHINYFVSTEYIHLPADVKAIFF